MKLHDWQAQAVEEYFRFGGAFLAMPVGAGKTTVAATIAARCERPVLLAPARGLVGLRELFPGACAFRSHTMMCTRASEGWLEAYQPTDILVDEAHLLRNISTNTAARRLNRYLVGASHVKVLWMTGTPIRRSLADCVHGLRFALRGRAPLPTTRNGLTAFIERVDASEWEQEAFYEELRRRPGVFLDSAPSYDGAIELCVVRRKPALVPDEASEHWERGPAAWGVRYHCVPPLSDEFRAARCAWNREVDYLIGAGACDTEAQARLVRPDLYAAYTAVEDREPEHEHSAEWVDDSALREALHNVGPGTLVWAHHKAIQERAAQILGCAREPGGDVAVLSIARHSTSLNLQRYNENLILEPPADAATIDQLIGRTARQGQLSPYVRATFVCAHDGAVRALTTAVQRAKLVLATTGNRSPLLQLEGRI